MKRNIMEDLISWKNSTGTRRMPLVLQGARQTGKTYILRELGEKYFKNYIYINFERMAMVSDFFNGDLDPDRLIRLIEEYFICRINPDDTLIIFDEIQACERALTSLKYFCEEAPQYYIAAAGSLLGVAVNRSRYSFPVGKVYMKTLYPLRFDEFLTALGYGHYVSLIREYFDKMQQMPENTHMELISWYNRYLFIGGMPAVINAYNERHLLMDIQDIQELILNTYTADMSKYASEGESTKIRNAFLSIPAQLARDNKKFQYKLIRKGATAGLFGDSIAWLTMAGVVLQCRMVSEGKLPLAAFMDLSAFKLYMSDVGLLSELTGILPENITRGQLSDTYKGALAENYTAQTLKAGGHEIYYWNINSPAAEVDFVLQRHGEIIPVEVKSGNRVRSKSLAYFRKLYNPDKMYRLSERNFGYEDGLYSVPLYAAFCI